MENTEKAPEQNAEQAEEVTETPETKEPAESKSESPDYLGLTAEEKAAKEAEKDAEDAAAKEAEKAAKEAEDKAAANRAAYGDLTGNAAMDDVTEFLKAANAPADVVKELFSEAHETRDLSKIDQDKLVELVGEPQARLIMSRLEQGVAELDRQHNETLSMLHEAAGGKDMFDSAAAWFRELTDGEVFDNREELRETINSGGLAGKLATEYLVGAYKNSGAYTYSANLIEGDTARPGFDGYLSQQDYIRELNRKPSPAQQAALDARRIRSMAMEQQR